VDLTPPTMGDVMLARRAIAPYLRPSPVMTPPALAEALGCEVVLKCECLNPTGAFKVRGGLNLMSRLTADERARGVVTASTGNHGQSIAFAAGIFGVRAVVLAPEGANPDKLAAMRRLGAEVVLHGRDFDEARLKAEELSRTEGLRYVHSANEPWLIAGVATHTLELLEAAPDLDALFVPVGAGSGVCGAGLVVRALRPEIRLIGVQAAGAPAVTESWRAGRDVSYDRLDTVAEGLATRVPFELTMGMIRRLVDDMALVDDGEMEAAIRLLLATARLAVEHAGAAPLAAVWRQRAALRGKRVGLIVSGGNIPFADLQRIVTAGPGRPVE
jgi:threonine dehydratase